MPTGSCRRFEVTDILQAIKRLLEMEESGPALIDEYSRAVKPGGNPRALAVMARVFEPSDAEWRGLFTIGGSGLAIREEFAGMDAGSWEVELPEPSTGTGCRCGEILCGRIKPMDCPFFGDRCTPDDPVGPCMVSSEGTCASYYLYSESADEGD
jgi:hydrogenase expression/formation protein HypD